MSHFDLFVQRKQELATALETLIELLEQNGGISNLTSELQALRRFEENLEGDLLFRVLCVGDFSTGKSTFINKFLLEQELLPSFPTPTTALPTRIRYGEQLKATLLLKTGESREITEDIRDQLKEHVAVTGSHSADVQSVDVEVPTSRLAVGVEIVDAPGLNDPDMERMRLTLNYLLESDAILFFLNAQQPFTAYQQDFFEKEIVNRETLDRLFVVANYWDQVETAEREEVLHYIESKLAESLSQSHSTLGQVKVLPVSAKTGENADEVQQLIWDNISKIKFTDVLSLRLRDFNCYLDRFERDLEDKVSLINAEQETIARRRQQIEQEIEDYREQQQRFQQDLKNHLIPEFNHYRVQLADVFDQMAQEAEQTMFTQDAEGMDIKRLNIKLASRLNTLQESTTRRLRDLDREFGERVMLLIEQLKAQIDAPPVSVVKLEEYFLQWPELTEGWEQYGANTAGGVGIAGLLLGAGSLIPTLSAAATSTSVFGGIGSFLFGSSALVGSSVLITLGIPGAIIGALALGGAFFFRSKAHQRLVDQLNDQSEELQRNIQKQKWQLLDGIEATQNERITTISDSVVHEIHRFYKEKTCELEIIEQTKDNGKAVSQLHDRIAALRLDVNP